MTDAAEVQATDSKAGRCFYVAHAYLTTGKQLEAHALFGRAAAHSKQAVRQHQVRPCVVPQNEYSYGNFRLQSIVEHVFVISVECCLQPASKSRLAAWAFISGLPNTFVLIDKAL